MTDWTTIADTQLDPKSPVTSELMTAMRDNPIAIIEGATGAPRILGDAAATPDEYAPFTVTASDDFQVGVALSTSGASNVYTTSTTFQDLNTFIAICVSGTIRFKGAHLVYYTGGYSSELRVLKNDVQVASWTTTSATVVYREADISVAIGDEIKWQVRKVTGGVQNVQGLSYSPTASDGLTSADFLIKRSSV